MKYCCWLVREASIPGAFKEQVKQVFDRNGIRYTGPVSVEGDGLELLRPIQAYISMIEMYPYT